MPDSVPMFVEGNPDSRIRVIVYEDLQCKDCAWFRRKMDEVLLPEYGDHVAFEHRDFPLEKHDWSKPAAMAAKYFQTVSHGVGVAFRRDLLGELSIVTRESLADWVRDFALDYGAEPQEAVDSLTNENYAAQVEEDVKFGLKNKIEKTPTVSVGKKTYIEWIPIDELRLTINSALGIRQ